MFCSKPLFLYFSHNLALSSNSNVIKTVPLHAYKYEGASRKHRQCDIITFTQLRKVLHLLFYLFVGSCENKINKLYTLINLHTVPQNVRFYYISFDFILCKKPRQSQMLCITGISIQTQIQRKQLCSSWSLQSSCV